MSAAVSNRANHRPSKEKHAKMTVSQPTQPKADCPPPQAKATPEQLRIAMITSDDHKDDLEFQKKLEQVMEITGKSKEICAIALQDCKNDSDRAVDMILEAATNDGVGEWKETGKKKKRQQQSTPTPSKPEPLSNHVEEKPLKNEQNTDSERPDRRDRENKDNRKGRRFDSRPPRLSRGRGRDKPEFFRGDRERMNGENDNSDSNFGTFREGGFDDSRGRGRGRGGRGRGRGGRGRERGGGPGSGRGGSRSFERGQQKFDIGPQIDTWTNETAENAEKEPSIGAWGDMEDWNEDQWAGNLKESKVFTASTTQSSTVVDNSGAINDSNSIGQRLDLGALLNKQQNETDSYISQYNQQATETIKNTIGIGSNSRQNYSNQESSRSTYQESPRSSYNSQDQTSFGGQGFSSQDSRSFNSQDSRQPYSGQDSRSVYSSQDTRQSYQESRSPFSSQESRQSYNDSGRQSYTNTAITNHLQSSSLASQIQAPSPTLVSQLSESSAASAAVDALVSSLTQGQNLTTTALEQIGNSSVLPVSQSSTPDPTPQAMQQRPKPQRSKLPPPSKIPASAVEMPGHQRTNVDVQFGNWEFGADSSPFSFGGSESTSVDNIASTLSSSNSSSMNNHLSQANKQSESVMSSNRMTPPNTGSSSISTQDSPRQNMFQNSPYTTPTKQDTASLAQKNISPPEPIPFPPDRKSSPLVPTQRPSSNSSLPQGSVSTSKQDSGLSYSQTAPGSYQSTYHQQSNSVLSSSSGLSNSMGMPREAPGLNRDTNALQNSSIPRDSVSLSGASLSMDGTTLNSSAMSRDSVGMSGASVLTSSSSLTNSTGLSHDSDSLSNSAPLGSSGGMSSTSGLSNAGNLTGNSGLKNTSGFSSSSQPSSYQNQYPSGSNQYQASQSQFNQSGSNQYHQSGSSQYSGQNQYQSYGQSGSQYQNQGSYSGGSSYGTSSQSNQNSLYQTPVSNSYQGSGSSLYHSGSSSQGSYQQSSQSGYHTKRESQAPGSYSANATQSSSGAYQRDSQTGLSVPSSQGQMASYSSQNYQNNLTSNLQTSPLNASQISETLSKMSVKENSLDTRQSPQFENSPSTTSSSLPTTTGSSTLSSGKSTPSAVTSTVITTSTVSSTRVSNTNFTSPTGSITSKAPPNLPPGVPVLGHQYIMNQGTLPYFAGLQQPLYGYDELQMLQQRLPPLSYNYDLTGFGVPTSVQGRDQTTIGNVSYTGADNKMQRVEAQSPIPSTNTQQSNTSSGSHQQQQHFNIFPYGYYYPSVLPNAAAAAAGFQFPQAVFPVPPVTNAAHAGTTANTQFQKTYGSHTYVGNKGYDDLTAQNADFGKSGYGQSQNKVSAVSAGSVSGLPGTGELSGSAYGKSHTQMVNASERLNKTYARGPRTNHDGFDKQAFHAGTPPPFNLPLATGTQAGPLGAPATPYGTPFVPMMPHQAHSQLMHPGLQQDIDETLYCMKYFRSSTKLVNFGLIPSGMDPGRGPVGGVGTLAVVPSRGSHLLGQQSTTQSKATAGKAYNTGYWGTN
ncbi:hypothetical protein FSP39_002655 [Pinctada imbricata]|uniref:Uncharacterized protein n=1 Tax=Pinctada imbricata TaxID=66713 RepID=A0AA89C6F9_PINIB|nr:hypothetical protein FSP39_002655 [Pinctada imbricata]